MTPRRVEGVAILLLGALPVHGLAQQRAQQGSGIPTVSAPDVDPEPIISDPEFDRAVPPVAEPGNEPTQPPLAAPATVDSDAIDQPLTPLNTFVVTPIDQSRYTEAEDKPTTVRYRYRIEGLDELADDDAISPVRADDIRNQFHDVSVLEDGDGKAANGAMISARMEQDQKLLLDVLQSQGFYDATVQGALLLPDSGKDKRTADDRITVLLTVTPGPRYRLGTIAFDAPPVLPADLITKNFVPKSGDPIVADRILSAEATLKVALPENGYPFVKAGDRDILLDGETHIGDYTLPIDPGPRSRFGKFVTGGDNRVFEPAHIAKIARFKKGELYDSCKVDDLRRALVATGLFSTVAVEPQPTGDAAGEDTEYARIVVDQKAGPQRTLAAELGYATGEGIKLQGSWTHRNLFPPEGALIASATLGSQQQGVGGTFRRSNAGRRDRTVEVSLAECTDVPKEVADKALAHRIANAVEAAYRRTDFFDRRRVLMNEWAEYLMA